MKHLFLRKLATVVLVTASVAAFATLGDGGKKSTRNKNLLSPRSSTFNYTYFTLKSGYNYRGSSIFSPLKQEKYIMLNTVVTYERGNTTYLLPIKKKILLDKVKFSPTSVPRY